MELLVIHVVLEFLQYNALHLTECEIAVRKKFINHFGTGHIVKVGPLGEVITTVLVALNSGTVVRGIVPQLVGLEPVWGDPRDVTLLDVKFLQMLGIWLVCEFIENRDGQPTMKHLNHGIRIAMVVNWAAMSLWPNLQNIWDARGTPSVLPQCNTQVGLLKGSKFIYLRFQFLIEYAVWTLKAVSDCIRESVLLRRRRPVKINVLCSDI